MLEYEFHKAIAIHGIEYGVADVAPESLPQLIQASTSRLIVLGLYSDKTIFGESSLNHAQRAWHDTIHLRLGADTSTEGEYRVARQQCLELSRVAGDTLADILYCDLYGQTLYYAQYKDFPVNQKAFTMDYYKTGKIYRKF